MINHSTVKFHLINNITSSISSLSTTNESHQVTPVTKTTNYCTNYHQKLYKLYYQPILCSSSTVFVLILLLDNKTSYAKLCQGAMVNGGTGKTVKRIKKKIRVTCFNKILKLCRHHVTTIALVGVAPMKHFIPQDCSNLAKCINHFL